HLMVRRFPPCSSFYAFFFQAEDGIRDSSVTGVQTCALPISNSFPQASFYLPIITSEDLITADTLSPTASPSSSTASLVMAEKTRSEERRVGKECGGGWGRDRWREIINIARRCRKSADEVMNL